MKIGFTGTSRGATAQQKLQFANIIAGKEFHHGDCVGADAECARIARLTGLRIIGHPPSNPKKRAYFPSDENRLPEEYLVRNRAIVAETEMLVACPKESEEVLRSGTWATIRYARSAKRRIIIILPDGTIRAWTPPRDLLR